MSPPLAVVAGIVRDAQGRILITQRLQGTHMAGRWEFPGGKLAPGEDALHGLVRELREELGIEVRRARPFMQLTHDYSTRAVALDFWHVIDYDGVPASCEGQALRWLAPHELAAADILEADRPVIDALCRGDRG